MGQKVSEKCDWVAFTVPFYKDLKWPDCIDQNWKEIRPIRNYNKGQENKQGVKLFWHTERPGQGKHIVVSGTALMNLGTNISTLLSHVSKEDYRITRLDLCVDVICSNLNPKNATYHLIKGQYKSHARSAPKWDDSLKAGYTQYVGKKTSETYFRMYDKASEMGTKYPWIRAEIVFQGDRGTSALNAYLRDGSVAGLIRSYVDFPQWKKWKAIMGAPKSRVETVKKATATREWLLHQVAKSLAKEMAMDDDQDFYLTFLQRTREEYLSIVEDRQYVVNY